MLSRMLSYCLILLLYGAWFVWPVPAAAHSGIPTLFKSGFIHRNGAKPLLSPAKAARLENQAIRSYAKGIKLEFPEEKVALVTGGGRGIGECIAKKLAEGGVSKVICVDLDGDAAAEVAKSIDTLVEKNGVGISYAVDVANATAVGALCEQIISDHGGVDILVNNAGITRDNLLMRMDVKEWDSVINVNLNSCFYFTKPLIRGMAKKRWGRIINMASVVGVGGNAGQANYAASKAGMIALAKSIAKEMGSKGITANALAPGFIRTAMTDQLTGEQKEKLLANIPGGRLGQPSEVADAVAFLASNQASYLNGHVIPIDGGMIFGYP